MEQPERPPTALRSFARPRGPGQASRAQPLDDHQCGETKDCEPPGVGDHYVIPVGQSFSLSNFEKELHETGEQWRAKVVDILSGADTVAVLWPEEDIAELLWVGSAELNQAARSRKKTLFWDKMVSGDRVEVLNHQPDRLTAQLGENVPFAGEMLIDHSVRITDLLAISRRVTAS